MYKYEMLTFVQECTVVSSLMRVNQNYYSAATESSGKVKIANISFLFTTAQSLYSKLFAFHVTTMFGIEALSGLWE
jgi:hypothetical protein